MGPRFGVSPFGHGLPMLFAASRPLIANLLESLAIFDVDFGCFVKNPVQAAGRDYHRAGRIGVDVISRRDQYAPDLDRDIGRIRHYGLATPPGRLTATPGREVIAAQFIEVSQSAVGKQTGQPIVMHPGQFGASAMRRVGITSVGQHEHPPFRILPDRLVKQVSKSELVLWQIVTVRKVGDRDSRPEQRARRVWTG